MSIPRVFTFVEVKSILAERDAGASLKHLATKWHAHVYTIRRLLINHKRVVQGPTPAPTPKEIDTIVASYAAGSSLRQLAAKHQRDESVIRRVLVERDVTIEQRLRKPREFTAAETRAILTERRGGASLHYLADKWHVHAGAIRALLRDHDQPIRAWTTSLPSMRVEGDQYKCRTCNCWKPFTEYPRDRARRLGRCPHCFICTRRHQAARRLRYGPRNSRVRTCPTPQE